MVAQLNTHPDNASVNHNNLIQTADRPLPNRVRIVDTPGGKFASEIVSGALEIAGLGRRVLVVQLLKGGIRQGHDRVVNLAQNLDWIRCNSLRNLVTPDLSDLELHNFQLLWQHVRSITNLGEYSLVILDGLSHAIDLGLIGVEAATTFLTQLPQDVDVVLTGTNPHPAILELTCNRS